jgi:nitrogen fixation/metabolism regulation signal transduction histidine kinase
MALAYMFYFPDDLEDTDWKIFNDYVESIIQQAIACGYTIDEFEEFTR